MEWILYYWDLLTNPNLTLDEAERVRRWQTRGNPSASIY